MLNDRPPPAADIGAEMALLGCAVMAPEIAGPALVTVAADDWYNPRHELIARTITDRLVRGEPIDAQIILMALMGVRGAGDDIGPYLHTLVARAIVAEHAPLYAERVREVAGARHLTDACIHAVQRIDEVTHHGDQLDLRTTASLLMSEIDGIAERGTTAEATTVPTVIDLLSSEETFNWLVPGLLERMDRLILTGSEGAGKSVFIAQLTACLAAGVHPFTHAAIDPARVLVIDCENPITLARRRYRSVVPRVERLRGHGNAADADVDWTRLHIEFRPAGLNITKGKDLAWVEARIAATAPDVLALGPLYKLHSNDINDEQVAREITSIIDSIRARHDVALITEAHAGNAQDANGRRYMRPRGSSLFRAWPEFGYGLLRSVEAADDNEGHPNVVDMVSWRGGREERDWPDRLQYGTSLPWLPGEGYRPGLRRAI